MKASQEVLNEGRLDVAGLLELVDSLVKLWCFLFPGGIADSDDSPLVASRWKQATVDISVKKASKT